MNISKQNTLNRQSVVFRGSFYNSKILKGTLKYAADKGALVVAGSTFVCSTVIRPAAILATPNTTKKDKQFACTKSIESGILNAGLIALFFKPLSKAIDVISHNPKKYLKKSTIKKLKQSSKSLEEAPAYNFIKQIVKLSPDLFAALPKSLLITFFIVPITSFLFDRNKKDNKTKQLVSPSLKSQDKKYHSKKHNSPTFNGLTESFSKKIVENIENPKIQDIALKYKDTNFIQHLMNLKDVFATACFAVITCLNPSMKKENKKPLIFNTAISTALTIVSSYVVDRAIKKPVEKFTAKFIEANKKDKNLSKYLNGIKVLKPIIILSSLYYIIIPMLSTFGADKLAKKSESNKRVMINE